MPSDFEPLLIFGEDVKLQAIDPFLTLLFHFQQILNTSSALVGVGYSFGDTHINAMISEALQRDPRKGCIVANPDNLVKLLPDSSGFQRVMSVEQRFVELKITAEEAFGTNKLLETVENVIKTHEKELPF